MIAANISKWTAAAAIGLAIGMQAPGLFEPKPAVEIVGLNYNRAARVVALDMLVRRSSTINWRLTLAEASGVVVQDDGAKTVAVKSNPVIEECSRLDRADIERVDEPENWLERLTDQGVRQETLIPIEEFFPVFDACRAALDEGGLYIASLSIQTANGVTTSQRVTEIRAGSLDDEN